MPTKEQRVDSIQVVDGRLLVDVAITDGKPSASGKSLVHYTTSGNISINDGFKIGLNLYRSKR